MTWLIGILGIGGLGAALFLIPGLLPRAIEAAGAVLGVVRRNPWPAAVIALLLACGWLWMGKNKAEDQRDFARNLAKEERANHVQTIANYREAQKRARAFAVAQKQAEEARHKANAERIDRAFKNQLADARDATAEYIRTHRVRAEPGGGAAQGGGGSAFAAPGDRSASGGERSGGTAFMVAVAEADIGICTANTLRLEAVQDWAAGLAAH
ncbi:MAG: hypothetical protein V4696_01755 [Pseudomonadota bacterium]